MLICGALGSPLHLTYNPQHATVQHHLATCVETIALRHFTQGRPLYVSVPTEELEATNTSLIVDNAQMINCVLMRINQQAKWPVLMFTSEETDQNEEESTLHHSYIIFAWSQKEDTIYESMEAQLELMKSSGAWNPWGRFLVIVMTGDDTEPLMSLSRHVFEIMWKVSFIVNVVIIIPNSRSFPSQGQTYDKAVESRILDLYTWFPFQGGNCGKVKDVVLIDQWTTENDGSFFANVDLFPLKIPKNFMGCPITATTVGFPPFLIMTGNYTDKDGNTRYNMSGFAVEFYRISAEKMNLTMNFLQPSFGSSLELYITEVNTMMEASSDITIGVIPLAPFLLLPGLIYTKPFVTVDFTICFPCPARVHRMDKIISTFTIPVWLTLIIVLILTGAVFWSTEHFARRPVHTTTSLSLSFYNAWAILMGVSVTRNPDTWKQRLFFVLYVFYCFAIITVFQAFFVSYLVEPGHQKRLRTIDDLLETDLVFGTNTAVELGVSAVGYDEYNKFPESRRVSCDDMEKCMKRLMSRRDLTTANAGLYVKYIVNTFGIKDESKVVCYVDESIFHVSGTALLNVGSPFLEGINIGIQQCLEGGLIDRYWSELSNLALVRGENNYFDHNGDMYFVFTISHLSAAFGVLILGHAFSFVIFLCEIISKMVLQPTDP